MYSASLIDCPVEQHLVTYHVTPSSHRLAHTSKYANVVCGCQAEPLQAQLLPTGTREAFFFNFKTLLC